MNEVKMFLENENKQVIEKNVPENLVGFYKNAGWEVKEETKSQTKTNRFAFEKNKEETSK